MIKILALFSFISTVFLSAAHSTHAQKVDQLLAKQVSVNGTIIRYWEQGRGVPVVFVHGAISDHRYWEPQREAVAKDYRFIALDRRYFGTAPWPDKGVVISQRRMPRTSLRSFVSSRSDQHFLSASPAVQMSL